MNYKSMKELSDKLANEMEHPQIVDDERGEDAAEVTNREVSLDKAETVEVSDSREDDQANSQQGSVTELLHQQQVTLNRLLAEVIAQTAQITSLGILLNESTNEGRPADVSVCEQSIRSLNSEVSDLKDIILKQEKASRDILRDSKNFQAGVRARMQDELDQYHKLHAQNVYAPILTEIAGLYITTERLLDTAEDSHLKEQLKNALLDSLAELLEDNGVVIEKTDVGQPRSIRLCKTRKTIATGDESLKGKVAKSYNPSFVLGNQILQKEIVDTYIFDPALAFRNEYPEDTVQITNGAADRIARETSDTSEIASEQIEPAEETDEQE